MRTRKRMRTGRCLNLHLGKYFFLAASYPLNHVSTHDCVLLRTDLRSYASQPDENWLRRKKTEKLDPPSLALSGASCRSV